MIENAVYTALQDSSITSELALYNDKAAIFYITAPHDQDCYWGEKHFPRIDYLIGWDYDPERKTEGTLSVNIWCLNNSKVMPEDLAQVIQNEMSSVFLTDDDGTIYCTLWRSFDSFETTGENEPKTIGVTVVFDIIAFPQQWTFAPDPIKGLNSWCKTTIPNAVVLGLDEKSGIFRPSDDAPVIYFRLSQDLSRMQNSYAVATLSAQITGHVITPNTQKSTYWLKLLAEELAIQGEIVLENGTPMIITAMSFNTAGNPIKQGQLSINGEYRIMLHEPEFPTLNHAYMNEEDKNGN